METLEIKNRINDLHWGISSVARYITVHEPLTISGIVTQKRNSNAYAYALNQHQRYQQRQQIFHPDFFYGVDKMRQSSSSNTRAFDLKAIKTLKSYRRPYPV